MAEIILGESLPRRNQVRIDLQRLLVVDELLVGLAGLTVALRKAYIGELLRLGVVVQLGDEGDELGLAAGRCPLMPSNSASKNSAFGANQGILARGLARGPAAAPRCAFRRPPACPVAQLDADQVCQQFPVTIAIVLSLQVLQPLPQDGKHFARALRAGLRRRPSACSSHNSSCRP